MVENCKKADNFDICHFQIHIYSSARPVSLLEKCQLAVFLLEEDFPKSHQFVFFSR